MIVILVTSLKRALPEGDAGFLVPENEPVVSDDEQEDYYVESHIRPLFVGDSRTVGLSEAVRGVEAFAKNGSTLYYLYDLDEEIKSSDADCVIIGFGVNDLGDIDEYINYANTLGEELTKPLYFLTVNPVDEPKAKSNGYNVTNSAIDRFNQKLIDGAQTYAVIDTNGYLLENGFETRDGLHYEESTYWDIYNYVLLWIDSWG